MSASFLVVLPSFPMTCISLYAETAQVHCIALPMLHAAEPDLNRKPQSCTKREDPSRRLPQTCEPLPHLSLITSPITRAPLPYPTFQSHPLSTCVPLCAVAHLLCLDVCHSSQLWSFSLQFFLPRTTASLPCPPTVSSEQRSQGVQPHRSPGGGRVQADQGRGEEGVCVW